MLYRAKVEQENNQKHYIVVMMVSLESARPPELIYGLGGPPPPFPPVSDVHAVTQPSLKWASDCDIFFSPHNPPSQFEEIPHNYLS
ncbi:hypothetical protein CesoFtcFv8_010393 [Champsocephalus esox]|uniref:Uncharacterized protein n=1 Tax=Champsocephalus esox TaxID=159716 RepID=A0AAN8H0G9_9TELE|nr:hypothetical protein CesoFtcFv8_010393 [Champsocephalus esox]